MNIRFFFPKFAHNIPWISIMSSFRFDFWDARVFLSLLSQLSPHILISLPRNCLKTQNNFSPFAPVGYLQSSQLSFFPKRLFSRCHWGNSKVKDRVYKQQHEEDKEAHKEGWWKDSISQGGSGWLQYTWK